jgi:hypothetical protein
MDWNRAFELALAGAPAISVMLLGLAVVWSTMRMLKGIARLFRGKPADGEPEPARPRKAGRIEPVLAPVDEVVDRNDEAKSFDDLAGAVVSLGLRVDALERQLATMNPGGAQQKRGFTINDGVASTPAFGEVRPVKRH